MNWLFALLYIDLVQFNVVSMQFFFNVVFFNFSETLVQKMLKELQPLLGGMFVEEHFGHLEDIDYLMEEDLDVHEEIQAQENSNFDEEVGLHDIVG